MAFVITQNCCTDASCVPVCPVDCIRPLPGAEAVAPPMLYIDPQTCVDCGACVDVCPVDAIAHEDELPRSHLPFKELNAAYFAGQPLTVRPTPTRWPGDARLAAPLRVAVVGAGPSACYAVSDLVHAGAEVSVFERLPTPYGLVRAGVAPDHQSTKAVESAFEVALRRSDVTCFFNVEVGRDITHDELLAHHDAVLYAVGASRSRSLGIPGESLTGNHAAADVVGWYNGHPDKADLEIDLTGSRAVIVGNGNVALDVARVLVMNRDDLGATDVAQHALDALHGSEIDEVVILGRRGAADAAFSVGELLALGSLRGVDVVIRGELGERPSDLDRATRFDIVTDMATRATTPGNHRIVLWFGAAPVAVDGSESVEALMVSDNVTTHRVETSLVLRSIGYRGSPVSDLPFDADAGVIPNVSGRVVSDGVSLPGVYVTGWIKRGPRGVIGTNRTCARETVTGLLADAGSGVLGRSAGGIEAVTELLAGRDVTIVNWAGWQAIDATERRDGDAASRPRVKLVRVAELLAAAAT